MPDQLYSIEVHLDYCTGKLACIRGCPTQAIRLRGGKVSINPTLCIDCGECIIACPNGAITAKTDPIQVINKYKFKIAIVSPVLFGQFPRSITPYDIVKGLLSIGFDAVYDFSLESEIYFRAIQDYLNNYSGQLPIISSMCPVVVRLIQVSYPNMVGQVTPIHPPRELAGRNAKKKYSKSEGIPESDIGAIYVSPCPAKNSSIKAPAEHGSSNLDAAIGINDIYNCLLAAITREMGPDSGTKPVLPDNSLNSALYLNMAVTGGLSQALDTKRYITAARLPSIVEVIEDIEKGKIRNIDFLECFSCISGCVGGPLTVDNRFVARSKLQKITEFIARENRNVKAEVDEVYEKGTYFIEHELKPRKIRIGSVSIYETIEKVKIREELEAKLPGIDCCLCGAPSCKAFAGDVANGDAHPSECVLIDPGRIRDLLILYRIADPDKD